MNFYNENSGYRGGLTDIPGIYVGSIEDKSGLTGCTVIICPDGAIPGVAVSGGNPGTQQTDSIRPGTREEPIKAVLLTGGSNFGLAAASGVTRWLYDRGLENVPIVPTAVIFDLVYAKGSSPPDASLGYAACQIASVGPVPEGNVGAGAGATVGKFYGKPMKSGQGTASIHIPSGPIVAALAIVNPLGDVWNNGEIVVGALCTNGDFVNQTKAMLEGIPSPLFNPVDNTTIAIIATNALLNKAQAARVALLAHDGMARAVSPIHSQWDGDTVFCLATGTNEYFETGDAAITVIGTAAAVVLEQAIIRGALLAQSHK
ncbi:MAG: peptidase [Clostridia bacterium]|nr:peptidase [Clostridia bacterium]